MGLLRQALSGAKWTGAANLASVVLQFLQIAVLARLLHPEDFGLMALVVLVVGLAQAFADVGLSGAIIRRQDTTPATLSSLFWLNVFAGVVLCAILVLAAPLTATAFGQPAMRDLVMLAALSFLVTPPSQLFYTLLQKQLAFRTLAATDVASAFCSATVAIASAFLDQGVYSLLWGLLAGVLVRSAALIAIGMKNWRPSFHFRAAELHGYARFGAFQMAERAVNFLGFNLDKLLIGALIGVHGLGLYSVAYQFVMKPFLLVTPIVNRVALPVFAMVQADDARLRSGFLDGIRAVAMLLYPVYMGMIVLADPLVHVILGPTWRGAVPVLQLLAVLGFFYSIGNPIGSLLLAKGRVGLSFMLNVWMIVLYATAILTGARSGIEGVAAALVIATAFGLFPVGFLVRWILVRMRPGEYAGALLPALVASLLMAVCVAGARALMPASADPLAVLLACTVLGALAYSAAILPLQWPFILRIKNALS
jgi:O-antigen/teichoic acid export membrane protein